MPDTISFEINGEQHEAVVSNVPDRIRPDGLFAEHDGVTYAISMALGSIPRYPGLRYIARPVGKE